jgi:hypothetical protein
MYHFFKVVVGFFSCVQNIMRSPQSPYSYLRKQKRMKTPITYHDANRYPIMSTSSMFESPNSTAGLHEAQWKAKSLALHGPTCRKGHVKKVVKTKAGLRKVVCKKHISTHAAHELARRNR